MILSFKFCIIITGSNFPQLASGAEIIVGFRSINTVHEVFHDWI